MANIYLDYAAATPVDEDVFTAMKPYFSDRFYNPSALYEGARDVKAVLEDARAHVGSSIGSRPSEVLFTAGGTESANLAVNGIMTQYPQANLIISAVEHDAVRKPAARHDVKSCPVDVDGRILIKELEKLIDDKTALVSVMYANNEIGTVQPIKEVAEIVQKVRNNRIKRGIALPIYLHTDACQAPNYLDSNVARLGVDLMTLNGGKIYGPKQSGILYCRAGVILDPQITGGGQEFGMRSGTENVAFAVGFAKALQNAVEKRTEAVKMSKKMTDRFSKQLEDQFDAVINGHKKLRLPNNIHVTFPRADNERVLFALDELGIAAAAGSACSASSDEVSHVLRAIGVSESAAQSSIRFSIGKHTTNEEIDKTIEALKSALLA